MAGKDGSFEQARDDTKARLDQQEKHKTQAKTDITADKIRF